MTLIKDGSGDTDTLYVQDVHMYLKSKDVAFPEPYAFALALRTAKTEGCKFICVEIPGRRAIKLSTSYVEEKVKFNPWLKKFAGLDREWSLGEKLMAQYNSFQNGIFLLKN
jgi:hypothetical protein